MPLAPKSASPRFFPTLMGAFGVVLGFAAFVLVREQTHASSAVTFVLGLLAAAITSYAIETVRERAEGHEHGTAFEPGRVLGLIVLLAVFEVYVSGAEEVVKLVASGGASTFVSALFVSGITATLGLVPQLLLFAGLWIALGGAAAWSMMPDTLAVEVNYVRSSRSEMLAAAWRIGRGLLLVACMALTYVIVARLALTIWVLLVRPQAYAPGFDTLLPESSNQTGNPFGYIAVMMASAMESLAHLGRWGGAVFLLLTVALVSVVARSVRRGVSTSLPVRMLMVMLALLVLGPFVTNSAQFGQLVRIVSATTLTWIAPLVVLAVATPLLRAPSRSPRVWGIVAFAVAIVLVLVTWDRLSEPPAPVFVAAFVIALVVTSWLFWRGADVVKFWPLVALTLAIAAFEGSSVLQRLTFLTTFKETALLQSAPLTGDDEARISRGFRAVVAWENDESVDASTAALVAAVGALPDTVPDQQLTLLEQNTSAALTHTFDVTVAPLCRASGSPVFDTLHRDITMWCARIQSLNVVSLDSVQAFWQALFNASEPFGNGLTSLLSGVDEESKREALGFTWQSPNTAPSLRMAALAAAHIPGDLSGSDPSSVLLRTMRNTSLTSTTRLWMVLDAFARSSPPDERLDGWLNDGVQRDVTDARRADGLSLQLTLDLFTHRARHLASLVEARYLGGIPADGPRLSMNLPTRRPDRFARETRTLVALHFAAKRLRVKQLQRERERKLQPNVGAALLLELSLGASFAFWSTAGLLAGLARRGQ